MRRSPLLLAAALLAGSLTALPSLVSLAAAAEPAPVAGAPDRDTAPEAARHARIHVVRDGGDAKTIEIDLSGVGEAISAALREVSREVGGLDSLHVSSLDGGRRIVIRHDGHRSEVDLDAIMREVRESLDGALQCVREGAASTHRTLHAHSRHAQRGDRQREVRVIRGEADGADREELRAQLSELKAELESLRAELEGMRAERRR